MCSKLSNIYNEELPTNNFKHHITGAIYFSIVEWQQILIIICKKKCVKKNLLNEMTGFVVEDFTSL